MKKLKMICLISVLVLPINYALGEELPKNSLQDTTVELTLQEHLEEVAEIQIPSSYGEAAKMICMYIKKAPISLPAYDGGESGYIGRLVLEGIWGEERLNTSELITQEAWEQLYDKATSYLLNPEAYESTYLNSLEESKRKRIKNYKQAEKELGKKDTIELGTISISSDKAIYDESEIKLYQYLDTQYIAVQDLHTLGLKATATNGKVDIAYGQEVKPDTWTSKNLDGIKVNFSQKDVYIGNLRTYALVAGEELLVPLQALGEYYHITKSSSTYTIHDKLKTSNTYVELDKDTLINKTDYIMNVQVMNLYWNGEKVIEEVWGAEKLAPGATYANQNKVYTLNNNRLYLTSIVQKITVQNEVLWYMPEYYGQDNNEILSHYTAALKKREQQNQYQATLQELFPPSIIIGTMKYDVAPFKKGEQVEVYRADSGEYYYLHHGKEIIKVPWNSVKIPANPKVETKQATIEQLETYINSTGITSDTDYLVWTDLYRQMTYIFKKQQGKWHILQTKITSADKLPRAAILKCSTGHNITPTPRGTYKLRAYVPAFGMNKGYMCKTATQIFGDYLYHSIMFDQTGSYTLEGKGVLGQRASQGCIRFSPEESEWFYNTLPLKTTVWIN